MALIALAVYSTEENGKDEYLEKTLLSIGRTVDFNKHRLGVSVNALTEKTLKILKFFGPLITIHNKNQTNIGTAEAINKIWQMRNPGENAIKMDDDVVIHNEGWVDLLEEAIHRDSSIGICGCKRKDCIESPTNPSSFYRSSLYMLPHEPGQKWITGEKVSHVMGTAQMYNSKLLDKIGYLWQPGLYGFDDCFAAIRSIQAGFINVFIPSIEIDHIDPGTTPFQKWKENEAGSVWNQYPTIVKEFQNGTRSIYYNPFEK